MPNPHPEAPDRIYLQDRDPDTGEPLDYGYADDVITWCFDRISIFDTEYVRADLVDEQQAEIKAKLKAANILLADCQKRHKSMKKTLQKLNGRVQRAESAAAKIAGKEAAAKVRDSFRKRPDKDCW